DRRVVGSSVDGACGPAVVVVAWGRAAAREGAEFGPGNTVVVGDSLEVVGTGVEGGAHVIAVASGTTPAERLAGAGADAVLPDLPDAVGLVQEILALTGTADAG